MNPETPHLREEAQPPGRSFSFWRLAVVVGGLAVLLLAALLAGISLGSSATGWAEIWQALMSPGDGTALGSIVWRIRVPRVLLAALVGAALSSGGLVFQAILRNPLAEPYILGISGGAAIGAILGILMGLARFPGVGLFAFAGSMGTLAVMLMLSSGPSLQRKDSLLLSGVMVNAFCTAVIMFLISLTQDTRLHNIMFWLMGDFSAPGLKQVAVLAATLAPVLLLLFRWSHRMNLLLLGDEMAQSLGLNVRWVILILLVSASFMVSTTVSHCGLIGFVGLVVPHLLRLLLGPDHRLLVPACIMGGGAYLVFCDTLARVLPRQGEMPAGVVTALIGAPLFIFLMKRSESE
jgi:iron complex transport system permease protein